MSDWPSPSERSAPPDPVEALLKAPAALRPHLLASYRSEGLLDKLPPHPELDAAERTLADWIERSYHEEPMVACELDLAPDLVTELLPLSLDDQVELLDRETRFCSWGVVIHLLEEAFAQRFSQPRWCFRLSCIALRVARTLDPSFYGVLQVQELTTLALARIANASRLCSGLDRAGEFLQSALGSAQAISCPRILAEVALIADSYHRARHDQAAAQKSLESALEHLARLPDPPESLLVCALVKSARRYVDQGHLDKAVEILERVARQTTDPLLSQVVLDNLALYAQDLRDLRAIETAWSLLADRELPPILDCRRMTLEATHLDLLDHPDISEDAARLFDRAGERLGHQDHCLSAMLAFLDAARIYARQGPSHKLIDMIHKAASLEDPRLARTVRRAFFDLASLGLVSSKLITEDMVADLRHHLLTRPSQPWEIPRPTRHSSRSADTLRSALARS